MQGVRTPPPSRDDLRFSNTIGILQKKTMWFIGVEVETSAPPPKKNPGSAPVAMEFIYAVILYYYFFTKLRVTMSDTKYQYSFQTLPLTLLPMLSSKGT